MHIILVHLGNRVPPHLFVMLDQLRIFNPDIPVFLIANASLFDFFNRYAPLFKYKVVCAEKLPGDFSYIDALVEQPDGSFYNAALKRFYYMHAFLEQEGLTDVIHFENDVMVYFDIASYRDVFSGYQNIAITKGTPYFAMTGFSYIKNAGALGRMLDFFERKLREPDLKKRYGLDKIQEMALLGMYLNEVGEPYISELPSLPFGPHSARLREFGGLFDPAAWGQYLGGIVENGCTPGWKKDTHFIGKELIAGTVDAAMKTVDGMRVPMVSHKETGEEIKLYSLHVHGKRLNRFLSKKGIFEPEN